MAETDLLCNEETINLCFDDGDLFEPLDDQTHQSNGGKRGNGRSESEPLIFLPCPSEDCVRWMVERESKHIPRNDYLMRLRNGEMDMSLRKEALDWIFKEGKKWIIQLAAVACLSMAAKIDEVNVPSIVELQAGDPKFLFEGKNVKKMEIFVLSLLKWNIKPHTPFNFIEYFIRKMNDDEVQSGPLIARSFQIISSTIKGIDFLEFRPSEIAAAVAVYVSGEKRAMDIDKALSGFFIVEKGSGILDEQCKHGYQIENFTKLRGKVQFTTNVTEELKAKITGLRLPQSGIHTNEVCPGQLRLISVVYSSGFA
ncbi:hypothetical protein DH2020_046239 [Rehmannia glutinosa]|uniref:B-like cyclin n=1 Tax=Rehmannia glutinosa TaxID=99300 RepID=A0ABR0UCE8_REHGL